MSKQQSRTAVSESLDASEASAGTACCVGCGAALDSPRCNSCGSAKQAGGYRLLRVLHESDHARVYLAEDAGGARIALRAVLHRLATQALNSPRPSPFMQ